MSVTFLDAIIDEINEKIDPLLLIQKINYFPEKAQTIGPSLKAFCPIHQEKTFRSIIIDLNKKTYKCSLKTCAGFQGGTLIDLYAKITNQSYLKAAFSIAELLGIPIDLDTISRISQGFYDEALQAFQNGKLADAERSCLQSLDTDSAFIDARLLLGRIYDSQSRILLAIEQYVKVIDGYLNIERYDEAINLLKDALLQRDPNNEEYLQRTADICEKKGDYSQCVEYLIKVAGIRELTGELERNVNTFRRILDISEDRDDIRAQLANLYETLHDTPAAVNEYLTLAKKLHRAKQIAHANEILFKIKSISPETVEARELLAENLLYEGKNAEFENEYLALAKMFADKKDFDIAEKYYNKLLEKNPKSIYALHGLSELMLMKEERGTAAEICSRIADIFIEDNNFDEAVEALKRAKTFNEEQPEYSKKLAEIFIKTARNDEGVEEYFSLSEFYLDRDMTSDALKVFSKISKIAPDDTDKRLRIGKALEAAHMSENALKEYIDLAKNLKDLARYDELEKVCNAGLAIKPDDLELNEIILESYLEQDKNEQALAQYKRLFFLYKQLGEEKRLLKILKEALELSPEDIEIHQELSTIYIAHNKIKDALGLLKKLSILLSSANRASELISNCQLIIQYEPENIESHTTLAKLYSELGDFEQSILEFDTVAELKYANKNSVEAINTLKHIFDIEPNHLPTLKKISVWIIESDSFENAIDYLMRRLRIIKESGNQKDIRKEYEWILSLSDEQIDLRIEYADFLVKIESLADAIKEYSDIQKTCLEKLSDYQRAASVGFKLAELQPNNYEYQEMLGYIHALIGKNQDSINFYKIAAEGYESIGEEPRAIECYDIILKMNPTLNDIRKKRACLFEAKGNIKEAINEYIALAAQLKIENDNSSLAAIYVKILELDESRLDIRSNLSTLYEELGNISEATEQYLILATHLRIKGDNKGAINICLHLKTIIPDNVEARKELIDLYIEEGANLKLQQECSEIAEIYLKAQNYAECEKYLITLKSLSPDDASIIERLATLYENQGLIDKACAEILKLSEINYLSGNIDQAIIWLEKLRLINPELYEAREKLASYYIETGRLHEAITEYLQLSKIYFEMQNYEKGSSLADESCKLAPADLEVRLNVAILFNEYLGSEKAIEEIDQASSSLIKDKAFEKAITLIEQGIKWDNDNVRLRENKIKALTGLKRIPEAIYERLYLAKIYFNNEKISEAEEHYKEILSVDPQHIEANYQLVECYLFSDRQNDALDLLEKIADLHEMHGDLEQSIIACKRVISIEPKRINTILTLAGRLEKAHQTSDAIIQYELIADYYINEKNGKQAEKFLKKILELDVMRLQTHKKLIHMLITFDGIEEGRKHFREYLELCRQLLTQDELTQVYEELIEQDTNNPELRYEYAEHLIQSSAIEKAIKQFYNVSDIYEGVNNLKGALNTLKEIEKLTPADYNLLTRIGRLILKLKDKDSAFVYLVKAARGFHSLGDLSTSVSLYNETLQIAPQDEDALLEVASLYEKLGQGNYAIEAYLRVAEIRLQTGKDSLNIEVLLKVLNLEPKLVPIREKLAQLYEAQGYKEDAFYHYMILGEHLEEQDEDEHAIEIYQRLKNIHEEARNNRDRLVILYIKMKQTEKAKAELQALAEICLAQQLVEDAEKYFNKIKEIDPDDYKVVELLGQLYESKGNILGACNEYTRVADIYENNNNFRGTVGALERVKNLDPINTSVRERLFEIKIKLGDTRAALDEGLNLISLYFQTGFEAEAEKLADKIGIIDPLNTGIRRELAKILYQYGLTDRTILEYEHLATALLEEEGYQEAIDTLNEGIEISQDSVSLHRLKVRAHLGLNQTNDAITTLKTLAQLFSAVGNIDDEEKVYIDILRISPKDIDTYKGLIAIYKLSNRKNNAIAELFKLSEIYIEQDLVDEAIASFHEILSIDEYNLEARDYLIRLLIQTKRIPEAVDQLFKLSQVSELNGDLDQARNSLINITEIYPESTDALLGIIALSEKLKDKVKIIQYSLKLAEIFEKLKATTDALNIYLKVIKEEPDHFEALKKVAFLYEEIGDVANIINTYALLAEKYQKRGAFGEAIQHLKKVAQYQPENVKNLRNLANLYLRLSDRQSAIVNFETAVSLVKNLNEWNEAVSIAREMVAVDLQRTASHEILAECLINTNNMQSASDEYATIARLYENKNDIENAIRALSNLLQISPNKTEEREKYALLLNRSGKIAESVEQYLILAGIYKDIKQFDNAIENCQNVIKIDQENVYAYRELADIYIIKAKPEQAADQIEWLVNYYFKIRDLIQTEEWIHKGLSLVPDRIALLQLAVKYYKAINSVEDATSHCLKITELALLKADYNTALSALETAKELHNDNIEIRRNLAEIYIRIGDKDRAKEEQFFIINIYLDQGLVEETREICDAMLKDEPLDIELRLKMAEIFKHHQIPELAAMQYVEIAKIYQAKKSYKNVREYVDAVLEIKPKNIEAREILIDTSLKTNKIDLAYKTYNELSDLYLENMLYDKAISVLSKMKEINSSDTIPREKLVCIYYKINQKGKECEELFDLAAIYVSLNRLEDSVNAYRTLLEYKPDDTQVRIRYIDVYSQIGSELELVPDYLKLIESFVRHGAVVEATKTFEKILKIDSNNTECRDKFIKFLLKNVQNTRALEEIFTLADIYIEQGSFKKAIGILNEGAKISPDDHEVHLKLSEAYNRMNAKGMALNELKLVSRLYQQKNMGRETVSILKKIIEIDSQNLEVRKELIDLCLKYNQTSEAITQSMQLADVYISRGMLDLAEKEYRRITKLEPENITAWNYMIETYLQIGLEEDLVDDYGILGDIFLKQGNLKESLKYFKKVLEIHPQNIETRKKYIDAYLQIGIENDLIEDYLLLADAYVKTRQIDEALKCYNHILALDPNNKEAKQKFSETQERARVGIPLTIENPELQSVSSDLSPENQRQRLTEAFENFENVIKMNPSNANAHCKIAEVLEQLGKNDDAYQHLDKASEIFFSKGETKKCISICEKMLKINPKDGKVRDRLSKAELKKDAFKALESAILASDTNHPKTSNGQSKKRD